MKTDDYHNYRMFLSTIFGIFKDCMAKLLNSIVYFQNEIYYKQFSELRQFQSADLKIFYTPLH